MDEDMEDIFQEQGFESLQVDLDYEFFAPCYFDFCRKETPGEAREAELWFETVGSDPPSPLVVKLNIRDDGLLENVNTLPKCKVVEHDNSITNCLDIGMGMDFSLPLEKYREVSEGDFSISCMTKNPQVVQHFLQPFMSSDLNPFHNASNSADLYEGDGASKGLAFVVHDGPATNQKAVTQAPFPKGSTLMKPTASQLAKQNRPRELKGSSRVLQRIQNSLMHKNERDLDCISKNESQAAKRQKLEDGHLRKAVDIKQQISLIHKVPKKAPEHKSCTSSRTRTGPWNKSFFKDAFLDGTSDQARLRLTIPREPIFQTAQRAQRMRPKNTSEVEEHTHSTAPKFKARPLNRKILEAPLLPLPRKTTPQLPEFQEFHLKTSERAVQHSAAAPPLDSSNYKATSSLRTGVVDSKRSKVVDDPKKEIGINPKFKALPLNRKIFSSKGDIGVFRNSKREATIPQEFNFPTDKRFTQQNPPIELFSKLSLRSKVSQNAASLAKMPQPPTTRCLPVKGSKENIVTSLRGGKIINMSEEKLRGLGEKQMLSGRDANISSFEGHKYDEQRSPLKEVHGMVIFSAGACASTDRNEEMKIS